ncbi:Rid family hydrolase [Streptomyces sp. B1866]|uniref:Rid family hydrolase n=1 Tax=Streptomyces sp. B1866 TaxID=3075431 RepID=UPI002891B972|nr:Rid family hydrolase [Streptomyces sp. B1866]MDT3398797.1 Rid family hydrolase [Streptomyces sp. B1866]
MRRLSTGGPLEEDFGCARAVAAGDLVLVSGTLPVLDGVLQGEGDPYQQTLAAFRGALAALEEFGLGPGSVVRTRMYLAHARDVDEVARAHRELFGAVRPAATLVVVSGFVDAPRVLVQVELEAHRAAHGAAPDTGRAES